MVSGHLGTPGPGVQLLVVVELKKGQGLVIVLSHNMVGKNVMVLFLNRMFVMANALVQLMADGVNGANMASVGLVAVAKVTRYALVHVPILHQLMVERHVQDSSLKGPLASMTKTAHVMVHGALGVSGTAAHQHVNKTACRADTDCVHVLLPKMEASIAKVTAYK